MMAEAALTLGIQPKTVYNMLYKLKKICGSKTICHYSGQKKSENILLKIVMTSRMDLAEEAEQKDFSS